MREDTTGKAGHPATNQSPSRRRKAGNRPQQALPDIRRQRGDYPDHDDVAPGAEPKCWLI